MDPRDAKIEALERRLSFLEGLMRSHEHRGIESKQVNAEDIFGLFGIPNTGVPFGLQRSNDGQRYRLWLFPEDEIFLASEIGLTVSRGHIIPINDPPLEDLGLSSQPWRHLYVLGITLTGNMSLSGDLTVDDITADDIVADDIDVDVATIDTIQFVARNVTSLSQGQMAYHNNAGTQQFRVNAGGFFGSIDLTGV